MGWEELNPRFRKALVDFLKTNGGRAPIGEVKRVLIDEGLIYGSPFYIIQLAEKDDLVVYDRNLQIVILKQFPIDGEELFKD